MLEWQPRTGAALVGPQRGGQTTLNASQINIIRSLLTSHCRADLSKKKDGLRAQTHHDVLRRAGRFERVCSSQSLIARMLSSDDEWQKYARMLRSIIFRREEPERDQKKKRENP
ncbi:jg6279 [Pararge aegeria aegeria]|uniref:Jg6279 protein n=1 Tax=Pararge aegeria aegeria TaxID=348720 RepID=A0A8S4SHR0_9NEOP|nr:jg6279 [Pararge aegeria aegeria]